MPAGICLRKDTMDKFAQAFKSGKLTPEKLHSMTTDARMKLFSEIAGEGNAKFVNREFESKLLLKRQELGVLNWAKKMSGADAQMKAELHAKIKAEFERKQQRLYNPDVQGGEVPLEQLVREALNRKYKVEPTIEQSKQIIDLHNQVDVTLAKADENGVFKTKQQALAYGMAQVNLENYVNEAKLAASKTTFRGQPFTKVKDTIGATPGMAKSLLSSLDDSFFGRQGIKTLLNVRTSDIWVKNFLKSFQNISRQLTAKGNLVTKAGGDDRAMNLVKAGIYSRPNAINGKYKVGNYGLTAHSEEAYPSSAAEKIPFFGRLFKVSEVAYNAGALQMRADLADRLIARAEKQGIDTLDKTQARGIGTLVGEMTGRGSMDARNSSLNSLLFSPKFLKANFDGLTLHMFDKEATAFTRKEAAKNMAGMVTSVGGVLALAHTLNPNMVETDPRSSNFGKIKLGTHWVDITGGQGALLTLAAKTFIPTKHNGEWGLWAKSKSGAYTKLNDVQYGQKTALDTFNSFWEGKLSPSAGVVRDVWSGKNYQGQKPTVGNELKGVSTPLPIQNYNQLKDSSNSDRLGAMIADGLGFSVSTTNTSSTTFGKDWSSSTSGNMTAFKQQVGGAKFQQANQEYNQMVDSYLTRKDISNKLNQLDDTARAKEIAHIQGVYQTKIFDKYNYKAPKPTSNKTLYNSFPTP